MTLFLQGLYFNLVGISVGGMFLETKESTLTVCLFQTLKIKQNETRMINIVPQIYTKLKGNILQEEHSLLNGLQAVL